MSKNTNKTVIIVGAGPVGLSLAVLLKQMDVPFRIIEKRTEAATYSRAFAIQSRTLEIFNQLKVVDSIKSNGRINTISLDFYQNGKLSFEIRLPPSESSEPFVVGLNQSKTEEILENRLKELGVTVEHGVELKALHLNDNVLDYVEVEKQNKKEKIYASALVGCDGGHSLVRKLSGIPFTGESVPIRISAIDAVVETNIPNKSFGRIVGMIWINDNTARIIIPNKPNELDMTEEQALRIMEKNIAPNELKIKKVSWFNTFNINERRAETHCKGNVYLCGDAAHVHSPAGGQGMNTGIQDSYNLAWKLAFIMKGVGQPEILNRTFHSERSAVADMVLKNSSAMMKKATMPPSLYSTIFLNYFFPIAMSFDSVRHRASNSLAEVFIKYEYNDLVRNKFSGWVYNSEVPGVGLRLPSFELIDTKYNILTTTHNIIKGGHCFEVFVYIPEKFLGVESLDQLKTIVYLIVNNPVFLNFKAKSKHSSLFHQVNLVLTAKIFQPNQWAHQFKNLESAIDLNIFFNTLPTYLDQNSVIEKYFGFAPNQISMFILRPDGYVGLARPITPERCQHNVESYFKRFITPNYF